jgi:malonate-semialdehyde dehydrogenase (acetylating)/methylmalonate-semialdehyde dehydrogenase
MRIMKNYVGGSWVEAANRGLLEVENPSTGETLARVPLSNASEAARAVDAAAAAYASWKDVPVSTRVEYLFRLAASLRAEEDGLCRILSAEMGKSLPDAHAELKRAIENCEVACGMPVLQQGYKLVGSAAGIDGEVLKLPLGVFAMIAPFNFPAMVPFWFLPYAVATGNTFIIKASERVPMTMQRIAELIAATGLPPGVFNLVNGDAETAVALMEDRRVVGVSVVGSTKTCVAVAEKCAAERKRFQAMGGAKNHLVIMEDAKFEQVVRNMITSCFGCAGQRCMASSAIVAVGEETHRRVVETFVAEARKVIVADPLDPAVADEQMVMGPVISAKAKAFIHSMIEIGIEEGATLVLDGRGIAVRGGERGHFVGPTVFTDVTPGMAIHATEIFGPVVVILKAASLDEAIGIVNGHQYGNGASIYTQNGHWARRFKLEAEAGMIGVNVGIPAPVASLPFGGMKASLLSDIKAQGRAIIDFYTQEKVITERYWPEGRGE